MADIATEGSFPAEQLVDFAKRHRLPMPPAGARLVLAHTGGWALVGNASTSRDPAVYSPAFLLEENADGSILVLRGTEQEWIKYHLKNEPLWRPFSDEIREPVLGGYTTEFDRTSAFVCAVQLAARGDNSTAGRIWHRVSDSQWLSEAEPGEDVQGELKNPHLLLAMAMYRYLKDQVLDSPQTWAESYSSMKQLMDDVPALKADPDRMAVLQGLAAALEAKPVPANSTEGLLISWSRLPRNRNGAEQAISVRGPKDQIIERGDDAVPDLIRLVKDRRITTQESGGFMMAPTRICLLGELAERLLQNITGVYASRRGDVSRFQAWLERSRQIGEEQMLVESVFKRVDGKITEIKDGPAAILAQKFPQCLASLCEEFSKGAKPETQPWALAKAVVDSRLPKATKVEVLASFARRGSLEHKRTVLQRLVPLDPHECSEILLPIIQNGTGPNISFTHCVMLLDDDVIWRAYLAAAKRSPVSLRTEMMEPMDYTYIGQTNRLRRLSFLAAFLTDEEQTTRFGFNHITVRDYATDSIARILKLGEYPDEFWTPAQWATLRDQVKRKLGDERLPAF